MDKLNSRHFIFFILGTCIISMKMYPNLILKYGGRDSWIAVIIASIIILLFSFYILWICKKTNTYNILKIYSSLSKPIGTLLIFSLIITLFFTLIESSSIEANSMHVNMLLETPSWYILIFFLAATSYTVYKGTHSIILVTIVGIACVMIAGTNLGIMTLKYKKFKYLLPILANGFDKNFTLSIIKSIGVLSSFTICLPYIELISDKDKLIKNSIIGLLIVIQMQIISITGVITTFGINRALNIWYPKLIQTQLVGYFGFLESGEFFVMLQIVGGWFIKFIISFNSIFILLKNTKFNNKYIIIFINILVYIFSFYLSKNIFRMFYWIDFYIWVCLINFFIIPLIVFTIHLIKFNHNNNSNKNTQ